MKRCALFIPLIFFSFFSYSQQPYPSDFEFMWTTIKENYPYGNNKRIEWDHVQEHYKPFFDTVSNRQSFVLLLEKVFNELYDHHASLNTNTKISQRLVPSGTDIWAEYMGARPLVVEVRPGFGAANAGLKPGMEIISINDIPVEQAMEKYLPVSFYRLNKQARDYALRVALAGLFIDDRKIIVNDSGVIKTFYPDRPEALLLSHRYDSSIESEILPGNIGYIKINDRLWDNDIIHVFDSVLYSLRNTKSLILDLRSTPSGGNTTVARAIMGSFITKEGYYQKHELTSEESATGIRRSWVELVSPRKNAYTKPLAVLVNHWTGSVGEGIAIGFDGLKRGTIIGTPMARLNGANYSFQMPGTKIGFSFPGEKLFHVNGKLREDFLPAILVDLRKVKSVADPILQMAINFIKEQK